MSDDGAALADIFDRPNRRQATIDRDRYLLTKAAAMDGPFGIEDVGRHASYFPTARILRACWMAGELVRLNPQRRSPVLYQWRDELEAMPGFCGHDPVMHATIDYGYSTRGVECSLCGCNVRCWS